MSSKPRFWRCRATAARSTPPCSHACWPLRRPDEKACGRLLAQRFLAGADLDGTCRCGRRPSSSAASGPARAPGRRTSGEARRRARQPDDGCLRASSSSASDLSSAFSACSKSGSTGQPCGHRSGCRPLRDALDHLLREGVAELVGVDVGLGGRVAHEVREQSLDDPVLAHDTLSPRTSLAGQERLLVLAAPDQAVARGA